MKLYMRLCLTAATVFVTTSMLFSAANAEESVFSDIIAGGEILNAMPTKNTDTSIYVTCKASVDMKSEASNDSDQVRLLPSGYNLSVLGSEYEWVYVQDDEGRTGYVYYTNVTFKNGEKPVNIDPMVKKGQEVASFSQKYLGIPYVWGGTSLTSGVDCSGFVYSIYRNFGISLNRSSSSMYASNGVSVSKADLRPGDLVFFNTGGRGVSHVGMYIGNNQYIHAATRSVIISNLYDNYSTRTYVGAKRILV